ncbi:MAG: hypothetical protein AAFX87_20650 [Bacteroidota bacterium]
MKQIVVGFILLFVCVKALGQNSIPNGFDIYEGFQFGAISQSFDPNDFPPELRLEVTNTSSEDIPGSLRNAYSRIKFSPISENGPFLIYFNIPGEGPHTIVRNFGCFDKPVIIDGFSQPGDYQEQVEIIIQDNLNAPEVADGFCWNSDRKPENSIIQGIGFTDNVAMRGSGDIFRNNVLYRRTLSLIGGQVGCTDNLVQGNIFLFDGGTNINETKISLYGSTTFGNLIGGSGNEINIIFSNHIGIQAIFDAKYNRLAGNRIIPNAVAINLKLGGNDMKRAPVITSFNSNSAEGTSEANDIIELFLSSDGKNALKSLGTTLTNGNGNWVITGINVPDNFTLLASATDQSNNTSWLGGVLECEDIPLSINGLENYYYTTHPDVNISGDPSGGIFSGPGISGNTFSPSSAGIGVHTITYLVTDVNQCDHSITQEVEVLNCPPLDITISGLDGVFFARSPDVTLSASPSGGVFSGPGITGNVFSPSTAGIGVHTITYDYIAPTTCPYSISVDVEVNDIDPLCEIAVPNTGTGNVTRDVFSGRYVYQSDEDCIDDIELSCFSGAWEAPVLHNVVSASSNTLAQDWDYTPYYVLKDMAPPAGANNYETAKKGKWRLSKSYVYNTKEINYDKNLNTGTFDLSTFNYQRPGLNQRNGWVNNTTVTKYSPNGDALEERNALDIPSVAKFGYDDSVPYLTAQNATYGSVLFESFEKQYGDEGEDGLSLSGLSINADIDHIHSGHKSLRLNPGDRLSIPQIAIPAQTSHFMVKVWVEGNVDNLQLDIQGLDSRALTEESRSGEWVLYATYIDVSGLTTLDMELVHADPVAVWIFLDDLRIQPIDAQMSCYVYDADNLRLMAVFDDQHFGLYYHYNAEGKLIRKMIETERGVRTIQETFYNIAEREE